MCAEISWLTIFVRRKEEDDEGENADAGKDGRYVRPLLPEHWTGTRRNCNNTTQEQAVGSREHQADVRDKSGGMLAGELW